MTRDQRIVDHDIADGIIFLIKFLDDGSDFWQNLRIRNWDIFGVRGPENIFFYLLVDLNSKEVLKNFRLSKHDTKFM